MDLTTQTLGTQRERRGFFAFAMLGLATLSGATGMALAGPAEDLAAADPQRVEAMTMKCAKCHGPVYRDWENGSHGRINGYWDQSRGTQTRRRCIECHDPHAPRFAPLTPAPGPFTLRMGEPSGEAPMEARRDPLRIHAQDRGAGTATAH